MKQPKRLTYNQKIIIKKSGLQVFDWSCMHEDPLYLHIVNKKTGEIKIIDKKNYEVISHGN